jgi:uncharacterized protein
MRFRLSDSFRLRHRGREYLFVIKNAAIAELDGALASALESLQESGAAGKGGLGEEEIRALVEERSGGDSSEILDDLASLQLFEPAGEGRPDGFVALNKVLGSDPARPVALQSLIAHITQDCNLRCTYCYADHGLYGAADKKLMTAETVRGYLDLLLRESGDQRSLNFTFFGGEPLMNFPAIEEAVVYGRRRAAQLGKRIRFSMTTNGTLFDEEKVRFVLENEVSVTVSLDGPPEVHDAVRPRAGGGGSYAAAMARLRPLLAARRVPVRVTLTRRCLAVERIVDHLLQEGFAEVGVTPAATLHPELRLEGDDWTRLGEELERASARYLSEALSGARYGFTNLENLLRQFQEGSSRGYPCGAGAGLLAGNADGSLYACHRNVNDPRFALGGLSEGIDRASQRRFLETVHVKEKPDCDRCWLRSLCGGGCYHVGAMLGGKINSVPAEMCDHIRRWYLNALRVYLTLLEESPRTLEDLTGAAGGGSPFPQGMRDPHLNPFLD